MSAEPSVVAIMLTNGRHEMVKLAVRCFQAQTYANKRLVIYDTTPEDCEIYELNEEVDDIHVIESSQDDHHGNRKTIGYLRNRAIAAAPCDPDIIIHVDSDDISHANRFAEQVALLQSSGAQAVGYNELLFWREPRRRVKGEACNNLSCQLVGDHIASGCFVDGEAWLYSNPDQRYPPGSSLAYWRKTWEAKPFAATSSGEDERFCRGLKVVSVNSCPPYPGASGLDGDCVAMRQPRMICRIHSSNTSTAYKPSSMEAEARKPNGMWRKAPEWNSYCAAEFAR